MTTTSAYFASADYRVAIIQYPLFLLITATKLAD